MAPRVSAEACDTGRPVDVESGGTTGPLKGHGYEETKSLFFFFSPIHLPRKPQGGELDLTRAGFIARKYSLMGRLMCLLG